MASFSFNFQMSEETTISSNAETTEAILNPFKLASPQVELPPARILVLDDPENEVDMKFPSEELLVYKRTSTDGATKKSNPLVFQRIDEERVGLSPPLAKALLTAKGPSDLITGVYEGGLRVWEGSIDLVAYLDTHRARLLQTEASGRKSRGKKGGKNKKKGGGGGASASNTASVAAALGRDYGWWKGNLVGHSHVRALHPLPGQEVKGGGSDGDEDDEASSLGGGEEQVSSKRGVSVVRAPHWFFQKFNKRSDMLFVDDDVRLLASEDAGYTHLLSTQALRSPGFEQACRDAFSCFHVADAFARKDRRQRTACVEEPAQLLRVLRTAVAAVWAFPGALDLKARRATALIGDGSAGGPGGGSEGQGSGDGFVLDLCLLHALNGTREQLESPHQFVELVRSCVRAAGLVRFASKLHDDDDQRRLGRLVVEIAALRGRSAADEAAVQARKAEDARLEKLKRTHPGKYQEEMADRFVADKAAALVREREAKEAAKEAEKAAKEAAQERARLAAELVKAEAAAKRAKVAALNALADSDPDAYAEQMALEATKAEASLAAAGKAKAPGPDSEVDRDSAQARRRGAQRLAEARLNLHAEGHWELQEKRQRLRFRVAPLFNAAE
mmetsp:Transcript_84321/g.163777  ORF Transcript_84321/g.163777 Transcript_84321/m.163777 type:complete len:617 (-) Transcript_84321:191-2041(-)